MKDENIENEVNKMTRTSYDPEVVMRGFNLIFNQIFDQGFNQGFEEGREEGRMFVIEKLLLSGMDVEKIASILDVDICLVKEILNNLNI